MVIGKPPREPVLVVDFGTTTSSAALLTADRETLLKEPSSGSWSWPSAVCHTGEHLVVGTDAEWLRTARPGFYRDELKRLLGSSKPVHLGPHAYQVEELVAELLRRFGSLAAELHGGPVGRLLLTVPAAYRFGGPQTEALLTAGRLAGFTDVEFLPEPVAAALSPARRFWGDGDLVLIYDFGGGTFDTALVRLGPVSEVLGVDALDDCGGRDLDELIIQDILAGSGDTLEPRRADPEAGPWIEARLVETARKLKYQLSTRTVGEAWLLPDLPMSTLPLERFEKAAAPLIEQTIACCRRLLDRVGVAPADLAGVLLAGGTTHLACVRRAVAEAFPGLPVPAEDVDLAVIRGAMNWAGQIPERRIPPTSPPRDVRPIQWSIPGGTAVLERWLVAEGDAYRGGRPLARIRLADGSLHDLVAEKAGMALRLHVPAGQDVASGDWLLTSLLPPAPGDLLQVPKSTAGTDDPVTSLRWRPDGRRIALALDDGEVRIMDPFAATAFRLREPGPPADEVRWSADGSRLAYAIDPGDGSYALVACDAATGQEILRWTHTHVVHGIAWFPDDRHLLSLCGDDKIRIHDTLRRRVVHEQEVGGSARALALHPGGGLVAVGGGDLGRAGQVWIVNLDGGPQPEPLTLPMAVWEVAFSAEGDRLAVACARQEQGSLLAGYNVADWQPLHSPTEITQQRGRGQRKEDPLHTVAYTPDGQLVIAGGSRSTILVHNPATGAFVLRGQHTRHVRTLDLSPDGHLLIIGGSDGWSVVALTERGADRLAACKPAPTALEKKEP